MSFEKRIFMAMALCGVIWILFDLFGPKPPPVEETEDAVAVADEKAEGKSDDADSADPSSKDDNGSSKEDDGAAETERAPVEVATHRVATDLLALNLTNRAPGKGGLIEGIELLSEQFADHTTATDAFDLEGGPTLELSFKDAETDFRTRGAFEVADAGPTHVVLASETDEVSITERVEVLSDYEAKLTVTVTNKTKDDQSHKLHIRSRVGVGESSRYNIKRGLCRTSEDLEDEDASDVEDEAVTYNGPIRWAGVDSKYFAALLVPVTPGVDCEIYRSEDTRYVINRLGSPTTTVEPGQTVTHEYGIYIGPKELERLEAFSAVTLDEEFSIEDAVDWGFFGSVSEALGRLLLGGMRFFYGWVGSWGFAIVLLTVCIKVFTLPLTLKQMSSMKAMKRIQPQMAELKKKYEDDKVKQGQEMQALFAREGVNPLAGCFPLLIQMPIWFALYSMLGAAVELVHVSFLWLPDLTEQDPFYALPLALGAMMVLQNRMMPTTGDETQAKMMRWIMPVMFTAFMLFLPSGLGVYIFVNIVLSVIQTAIQVGTNKEQPAAAK